MKKQSGQTLLIAIMLLATALTIVLSVTFTSRTETQLTKLEEEHQKALAAAEAAIEAALKSGGLVTIGAGDLANVSGFSGEATVETAADKTTFVSPLLQADEQYTFYLSNYPDLNSSYANPITFYFASETGIDCSDPRSNPALELTLFYNPGSLTLKKWVIEPCAGGKKIAGSGLTSATQQTPAHQIGDIGFNYASSSSIDFSSYANSKFLLVRPLFAATRIGFDGIANLLPSQGKTITSTATSQTGASTVVQLFQSFPQIPAEFFVTSF